jgi:hypothetical protein
MQEKNIDPYLKNSLAHYNAGVVVVNLRIQKSSVALAPGHIRQIIWQRWRF